jgi:hypothetical protein
MGRQACLGQGGQYTNEPRRAQDANRDSPSGRSRRRQHPDWAEHKNERPVGVPAALGVG